MKNRKYYVTMTDKFMSGWGMAANKTNKLVIECETWEQARAIELAACDRDEMVYVNICCNKPYYNKKRFLVSERKFSDMGQIWIKYYQS